MDLLPRTVLVSTTLLDRLGFSTLADKRKQAFSYQAGGPLLASCGLLLL